MTRRTRSALGTTFLMAAQTAAAPIGDTRIFAVDAVSQLVTLDLDLARAHLVGQASVRFTDIAAHPDGRLFGVTPSYLYQIDPETAESTLIGVHGFGEPSNSVGIDSLAFDGRGRLYAAGDDVLISIDPQTGEGRRIGSLSGFRSAGDLTFDQDERLLLSTDQGKLVEVHRDGSGAESIGNLPYVDVYALGSLPSGEVIGVRSTNQLLNIDAASGRASPGLMLTADFLVGRIWGIAIAPAPAPVPEPATAMLLLLGMVALGVRSASRRKLLTGGIAFRGGSLRGTRACNFPQTDPYP